MTTATLTRPARTAGAAGAARTVHTTRGPRSGAWVIDSTRAVVALSGKASFVTPTINARFLGVEGFVEVDSGSLTGAVEVAVDVASLTTGNSCSDELINSFDPFDADHFPIAVYRSSRVEWTDGQARIDGTLTLRGVTRAVPLTASYEVSRDGERMLVRAAGTIDRLAFGISFDGPGRGKLLPRVMKLSFDVDAVLAG